MGYVYYHELSERSLRAISDLEDRKQVVCENDPVAKLFTEFEKDDFGKNIYSYCDISTRYPVLSVQVDSAATITKALKWFRGHSWKSVSFRDYTGLSAHRIYTLKDTSGIPRTTGINRDIQIELKAYFNNGTCEFVDEPTGDFEDVPEVIGVPAQRQQVMTKVLKCGDEALPVS